MRLIFVFLFRENYFKWWIKVEGLNHTEIRHLAEKIGEQPEHQVDSEKLAEFSVPSWLVREADKFFFRNEFFLVAKITLGASFQQLSTL